MQPSPASVWRSGLNQKHCFCILSYLRCPRFAMKFLHALAFASVALGAPNLSGDLKARAQSPVVTINVSLKALDSSCGSQSNTIRTLSS